ncbi:hypothetical protein TNCV_1667051 [Trichonephila clavipes]|nr:hypothetical protein TNCV_1667051 [Trichonephila clavipes]
MSKSGSKLLSLVKDRTSYKAVLRCRVVEQQFIIRPLVNVATGNQTSCSKLILEFDRSFGIGIDSRTMAIKFATKLKPRMSKENA